MSGWICSLKMKDLDVFQEGNLLGHLKRCYKGSGTQHVGLGYLGRCTMQMRFSGRGGFNVELFDEQVIFVIEEFDSLINDNER